MGRKCWNCTLDSIVSCLTSLCRKNPTSVGGSAFKLLRIMVTLPSVLIRSRVCWFSRIVGNGVSLVNHIFPYQLSLSVLNSLVVVLYWGMSPSREGSIVVKPSLGLSKAGV
jgi:hypothetical protein